LSIKDCIVQGDRKDAKAKCARAFEQLMGGVIHRVFGVIERMNVDVDFDPFFVLTRNRARAHAPARFRNLTTDQLISRRDTRVRTLCWFGSITIMRKRKNEWPT